MKKSLEVKDWKDILNYLIKIESISNLEKMRKSIFEQRDAKEPLTAKAMLAKKDIMTDELSEKEVLALSVYDLIGGRAEKTSHESIEFFGYKINIDLLLEEDFKDALKLVDLIATGSFPSQIEIFDREKGYKGIRASAVEKRIQLSDPDISLVHKDGRWEIEGVESHSEDLSMSVKNFNEVFYESVTKIIDKKMEDYNEFSK